MYFFLSKASQFHMCDAERSSVSLMFQYGICMVREILEHHLVGLVSPCVKCFVLRDKLEHSSVSLVSQCAICMVPKDILKHASVGVVSQCAICFVLRDKLEHYYVSVVSKFAIYGAEIYSSNFPLTSESICHDIP